MTTPKLQDRFQTLIDEHKKILSEADAYCYHI
jgi:hypothetical protein